jgi:hypothetical protein
MEDPARHDVVGDLRALLGALSDATCENRWRWSDGDCLDHDQRPPCWRCGAHAALAGGRRAPRASP